MNATKTKNTRLHTTSDETAAATASTEASAATAASATSATSATSAETGPQARIRPQAEGRPETRTDNRPEDRTEGRAQNTRARLHDADGMAVASFVLGLVGLLAFNLLLGPCAMVLSGLALLRGTGRRSRALLGMGLGAADLVVLAVITSADNSFSWSLTG